MTVLIEGLITYFGIVKAGKHIRYQRKRFRTVKGDNNPLQQYDRIRYPHTFHTDSVPTVYLE
jgi:hypothetical protein